MARWFYIISTRAERIDAVLKSMFWIYVREGALNLGETSLLV